MSLSLAIGTALLLAAQTSAPTTALVSLDPATAGDAVSPDFIGLSLEMERLLPAKDGKRYFSDANKPLVATFRALGVKSLRVGGNTADKPGTPLPSEADIDNLFAFARAAGVKVIYTLRLREGSRDDAAAAAKYVMDHHAADLTCFAIGNEPNVFAKEYPAYLAEWKRYVEAITAPGKAPGARFCGPSATPGKVAWAALFTKDVAGQAPLVMVTQHDYPGESARKVTDVAAARALMLSTTWTDGYQRFHDAFVPTATAHKLPYRLEEANSFFHGGAKDVSDTMTSALWALDYMYWWAWHGAGGINFHTGDEVAAGDALTPCRYASFWTAGSGYNVHPIGYALKAFDVGGHGRRVAATVTPANTALTAYGVAGENGALYLTLIRKDPDPKAATLTVTVEPGRAFKTGGVMVLAVTGNDLAATSGVTLGGAAIEDDGTWKGSWTALPVPSAGRFTVALPPATAAVLRLEGR